ncbi:hypothetical protein ENUP19_0159G0009 [Entamoeba nuttalli]|uniref:Uncharacterized protein n=1 Tax=Entamoeba nuttalli TaxID=412467 RepID=A0ABQ0DLF9_9EUKA
MSLYDESSENYKTIIIEDMNKNTEYYSKYFPYDDGVTILKWLCECQIKCTKGIISNIQIEIVINNYVYVTKTFKNIIKLVQFYKSIYYGQNIE